MCMIKINLFLRYSTLVKITIFSTEWSLLLNGLLFINTDVIFVYLFFVKNVLTNILYIIGQPII